MRILAVLLLLILLAPARADSAISPEHRTCSSDEDCALVMINCSECCSQPADFDAVNKQHVKEYENPGICTPEHIKACGVPECGLFVPEPYPVAICRDGVCAVKVHPADPRPQAPAPAPAACTEENAIAAVQSDSAFKYFCSGRVNGVGNGCSFKARPPSPLNVDEKNDKDLAWVVNASIIHSFDDKGQPRFMPEGTAFGFVSKDCRIMKTVGPNGPLPPAPSPDADSSAQPKKFFKDLFLH